MDNDHAPVGLLISALGAAVLAISVFMPWYGVSITAAGAASAQQELSAVVQQYGNTALQTKANAVGAQFGTLTGRQLATVSAHEVLGRVSVILLVLAGIALLASLLRLADMRGLLYASGGQIMLVGGLAAFVVLFRMLVRPELVSNVISLSLSWGIALAMLSAVAIVVGGFVAGSGRSRSRPAASRGPGPPTLVAPPSVRAIAQTPLSPRNGRRR